MAPCEAPKHAKTYFEPLDYYEAPSHLKSPFRILDLPNELLAAIALQLERNNDLRNLSLVCKRLRIVAQEALFNPVKLPENGIRNLLETLINRPDLAKRINHVDLGDYGSNGYSGRSHNEIPTFPGRFSKKTFIKCKKHITKQLGAEAWNLIFLSMKMTDSWGFTRSFFLALLAIMAPNLRGVSFQMRPLASPPNHLAMMRANVLLHLQEFGTPFGDSVMQFLGEKIKVLTVADNALWKGPYMHNLAFTEFINLKRLSLPINALISKNATINNLSRVLPSSLEHLQVRDCSRFLSELLVNCCELNRRVPLTLDLFFQGNPRSALLLTGDGDELRLNELAKHFAALSSQGWKITAYKNVSQSLRGPIEFKAMSLQAELDAWKLLTPNEVSIASLQQFQFSRIVARDKECLPRRRSKFEVDLVTIYWGMPHELFTSHTFNPEAWSRVRMFNGKKIFKDKPNRTKVPSAPTKFGKIAQFHKDQKPKIEKKPLCPCVFKSVPPMKIEVTGPGFDAARWLKELEKMEIEENINIFGLPKEKRPVVKKQTVIETPRKRKVASAEKAVDEVVALASAWKL